MALVYIMKSKKAGFKAPQSYLRCGAVLSGVVMVVFSSPCLESAAEASAIIVVLISCV